MMEKAFTGNIYKAEKTAGHSAVFLFRLVKEMKSYGRSPTFLLATGYEQIRSVVFYLTGDVEGGKEERLELPETGVCSVSLVSSSCDPDIPVTGIMDSSCCGSSVPVRLEIENNSCCDKRPV